MIHVHDIAKIDVHKRKMKKEMYTKIYEQFSRKIKQQVEVGHKHVHLRVPSFIFGYPSFDVFKAAEYLKRQLELGGFHVESLSEIDLYVSWKTRKVVVEPEHHDMEDFPTLVNLKKAANKYRKNSKP